MISFFAQNAGTIAVCLALAGIVAAIVIKLLRGRRKGECCGSCKRCPHGS